MEFLTLTILKRNGEATNSVILITNGAGEGGLGHGDSLLSPWSSQGIGLWCLSTLCQCNPSELSVMVVRRYSNSPYIWKRHPVHFIWMWALSQGASSTQFPLDRLHLHQLIPFSRTELLLPHEEGKRGWKHAPISQRFCGRVWRRNTAFLIWFLCQYPHWPPPHLDEGVKMEGGSCCHSASTQTEGGSDYHPSLKLLQDINQTRAHWKWAHSGDAGVGWKVWK